MQKTYFAYHLTHFFGPFGLENYHSNSEKPQEGDLVYVVSGDRKEKFGEMKYCLEGIFKIHRKTPGPWKLRSLSGEPRDFSYRFSMVEVRRPDAPIDLSSAPWYSSEEIHRYFSSGQNFNPLPTDPDYKQRFDELLAAYGQANDVEVVNDLVELERTVPDVTEREALSKARIGQGKFRADLVTSWGIGEVCALTGIAIPELLIASHIKPWRDSTNRERLDPANGLLLAVHADKLFDRHLMSFEKEGEDFCAKIHPRVASAVKGIGLSNGMLLRANRLGLDHGRRFSEYMARHHRRFKELVETGKPTS